MYRVPQFSTYLDAMQIELRVPSQRAPIMLYRLMLEQEDSLMYEMNENSVNYNNFTPK